MSAIVPQRHGVEAVSCGGAAAGNFWGRWTVRGRLQHPVGVSPVTKRAAKHHNSINIIDRMALPIWSRLLALDLKPHASLPFSFCNTALKVVGLTGTFPDVE